MMKHYDHKASWEERVGFALQPKSVTQGTQGSNLEVETVAARRSAAYWLVPHGLLSQLSHAIQEHRPRE